MPTPESTVASVSTIESELYFLIARFLSSGPCKKASEVLLGELKEHKLLPKRIDWEGREHYRSYSNLIDLFRHISCSHLLSICERLGPLLDKEVPPSITGVRSLLGAGSLSLLRTVENSRQTKWAPSQLAVLHHAEPLQPPRNIAHFSLCSMVKGRELTGRSRRDLIFPGRQYSHVSLHDRKLGHLSAVYCVSFDRTGQYIFTGADDHLVKIWSASAGRLLATFRGHAAEITDLAVNFENTLLACGSCDKIIRVWCLRTKAPVIVLQGHTGMITSVQFCPQAKGDTRYLATTGADGCVCFWQWNVNTLKFNTKPIKFVERSRAGAQMLCSSFSPGGLFLATGNSDNVIRVYFFHNTNPEKICELEAHKDRVDSITYSNQGMRFVSGSKDGTARIWRYERQEWKALVLNMATKLPSKSAPASVEPPSTDDSKKDKYRVTMVAWMMDDEHVVTAVSDYSLKVWDSHTGRLVHVLESHQDEVFVLEPSPIDARILLSAGHDGNIVIWNLQTGNKIKTFFNMIEGQGHGAVFDCKFAPDGLSFAAVDSHGHLLLFGFGSNEKYQKVPKEVFFHTDYRPLIRDANNYVLDEQTQQPPHLMPPPFLVDIDGNPYPPITQRLVPGRENCKDEMLIPEVAVNEEGSSEVIGDGEPLGGPMAEPAAIERARPSLDAMIQRLQLEQDHRIALEGGEPLASPPPVGSPPQFVSPRSTRNNQGRVGMRRSGETEGVRQSLGNVTLRATKSDIAALKRRVVVKPLDPEVMWRHEEKRLAFADEEFKKFVFERKKKPNSPHGTHSGASKDKRKQAQATGAITVENEETARNRLFTRALYDTEEEEEEEGNSSGSDFMHESDSDEYSDWMGDTGSNLQPPKRTSQRQRKRKRFTSTEDDPDDDDEDDDDDDNDKDNDPDSGSNVERKPKKAKPPPKKKKKKVVKHQQPKMPSGVTELSEAFRPPEWLTDTIPRKAPFVPQMGDEVMYFRQGHELYLNAVVKHKVYEVNPNNNQPWHKNPKLREQELVKIVGIKYEIRPPRLCCLKLAFIDHESGKLTGGTFSIKYHDMPDVIDFLVLKQTYNIAMRRKWKPNDRFRAMIDDHWWMGTIQSQEPFQAEFSDSMYQCFNVHWDNGEHEKLSPWDLELIDEESIPGDVGGGVMVEKEELKKLLYNPGPNEWPPCGRDEECDRIVHGLEEVMQHSMAEPFNAPVDLNAFPLYAHVIEYPVDLSTIKARLENRFYRRVNAVQFDIRHIESNTAKFNEPGSAIVQKAGIITETMLSFISDACALDAMPFLAQEMKERKMNSSSSDTDDVTDEATSSRKRKRVDTVKANKRSRLEKPVDPNKWKSECSQLIARILECEDSKPFRTAVDPEEYPDYYKFVENPMDFGQVQEKVETDQYTNPIELCRDVRLIFSNSKSYNTNKKSRIYAMTLRLSAMFEDQIKEITSHWKYATKSSRQLPKPSSSKLSRTSIKTNGNLSSASRRDRAPGSSTDSSQQSSSASSSNTPVRVTRSQGGGGERGSADGYSSGPTPYARSRRTAHTSRVSARKVIRSDGESEEDEETEVEEEVKVNVEDDDEEEEEVGKVRRTKRKVSRRKVLVEDESEEDDDDDDDEDDDDDDEEEEQASKPRGKVQPKRSTNRASGGRSKGSVSNGHSKPSYRTRAATGKVKPAKYMPDESSSLVSKSESNSATTSSTTSPSGRTSSSDSSSSNNSGSGTDDHDEEDDKHHSDYANSSRSSKRGAAKPATRSIQKQVESVRHSARERRKVQDNMFVYEQQRKSRIKTRNQGRRTVQYQEDESDNERANGRNGMVDSDSDSDSSENRSSPDMTTMSSRGRIRKLTPRARASLMGD